DITAALDRCRELLESFGGHELAAGFRLAAAALPELRRRLDELYRARVGETAPPTPLRCDAEITLDDIEDRLADDLVRLAPFGEGNPEPLLRLKPVPVAGARPVGRSGSHLKLRLGGRGRLVDAIAFGRGDLAAALIPGPGGGRRYGPAAGIPAVERPRLAIESAVRLRRNVWQGRARLELHVEDLRPVPEVAARPV